MKKSFFAVSLLLCACVLFACAGTEGGNYVYLSDAPVARFMTNVDGEKAALSTDRDAVGDNLLFASCPITVGGKLTPPAAAPERSGYVFGGWATDPAGSVLFDFDKPVFGGVTLYAKWSRDESKPKDTYTEPVIAYEEVIDDTVKRLRETYSDIDIKGYRNGYINDEAERKALVDDVV
ncbi:MAG: InlB B-repeat-containing protein, partial [Clostridia bacterium]|nr:InlB B-repeat-containing protein [Clostridia bacterium]